MLLLILRRLFWMIPTLVIISIISFAIIQLPPGDYLTSYIAALAESGETVDEEQIEALRMRYALDQPVYVQYFRWIAGMLPLALLAPIPPLLVAVLAVVAVRAIRRPRPPALTRFGRVAVVAAGGTGLVWIGASGVAILV